MELYNYWQKQTAEQPLFPDIEWSKPERKDQAGRLGIIGGSQLGFSAVAESYITAGQTGAGEVRILLPDRLRKVIPVATVDSLFGASTNSGGLAVEAKAELLSLADWAEVLLFIGDAGKNSQTAILYEELMTSLEDRPIVLTRDAIDLMQNCLANLLDKPHMVFVASFAQLQRIFQTVYYPKVLTFSMQLTQLIEAVHKFTTTYAATIVVLHNEQLIISRDGQVVSQPWSEPMRIWRGQTATIAASYLLWNTKRPLEAISASLISQRQ